MNPRLELRGNEIALQALDTRFGHSGDPKQDPGPGVTVTARVVPAHHENDDVGELMGEVRELQHAEMRQATSEPGASREVFQGRLPWSKQTVRA